MRLNENNPTGTRAAFRPGSGVPEPTLVDGQPTKIIRLAPLLDSEMPTVGTNISAGALDARIVNLHINSATPGTEGSALHGLSRVPVGTVLINVVATPTNGSDPIGVTGVAIKRGSTAWTRDTLYVASTADVSCNLTLLVF
jgi:hypothetical protein